MGATSRARSVIHSMDAVFIIGCPRSGTSATAWSLAQHPKLWTTAESDFILHLFGRGHLRHAYKSAMARKDVGWLELHNVSYGEFAEHMGRGVNALFRSRSKGLTWIDATPSYTLMAAELAQMFPTAKFLHMLRDGRAVVSSMVNSGFDTEWARDFQVACKTWHHFVAAGVRFESEFPDRCLRMSHETLTVDPDACIAQIFDFLELEHSTNAVEFIKRKRVNSSYDNVHGANVRSVKSPEGLRIKRWDSWSREMTRDFLKVNSELMESLGYCQGNEETHP